MRIVARLFVLLPLLWVEGVWAVDCPQSIYDLTTQAEVDALGATGCDRVSGYLYIRRSTDITNLDSLANITSIGLLHIANNTALTNLDGLASLTSVRGDLRIDYNDALTNVDGLANLTSVGGGLSILINAALTDLDGLANLTSVGGFLSIDSNTALTNLDGLANITSVGRFLVVGYNFALTNLDGLANITSVGESLIINGNSTITNLDGLANLSGRVMGSLSIRSNTALTNLDGLANITSVKGYLHIDTNTALTNLNGLASLASVGDYLSIGDNDALTNLDDLVNLTTVGSNLSIDDNDALTNLDGLANLNSFRGNLKLLRNDALTNVDGLANLSGSIESLGIYKNLALTNLDGLANLTSVGGYLEINGNAKLTNIDGLANITSVEADLYIGSNAALTNLDGLANVTSIGGGLFIQSNWNASCEGVAPLLGWPIGPPDDSVNGAITINSNATGCNSVEEVLASVSGPTQPTITNAVATVGSSIELQFSASTTTDTAFPVTSYEAACIGSSTDLNETPTAALLADRPIRRTLTVSGYDPVSVPSAIEVDINISHSDPTDLYITLTSPEGTELILWNQGDNGGEDIAGTFPTTLTPVDSLGSLTLQSMDGGWTLSIEDTHVVPSVREGVLNSWGLTITEELARSGSGSPITVNGVTRGRDYRCTVAPVTGLGKRPVSDAVTAKSDFPSTPNIDSSDYDDGQISLRVSVDDNGGADITGYEATCTDGTNTYTGTSTSSPITVSGLTNGVAYTCTVTATNSVGTSSASAATAPITPEETATGLPIWLLYQATQ